MGVCAWGLVIFDGGSVPIFDWWKELQSLKAIRLTIEVPIGDLVRTGNRLVFRPQFIQTVRHHGTKSELGNSVVHQAALY